MAIAISAIGAGIAVSMSRHAERVESEVITRPAPELGAHAHVLLPDIDGATMVVPDRPHDPKETRAEDRFERITRLRRFQVDTNSLGMRSPELDPSRSRPRVLCLGDSVTFGWGVTYEESWPARLSEALEVETVNAGVPAMKPDSIAVWAQQNAVGLSPDLVIFARRPDHANPDPWGTYKRSLQTIRSAVQPAPVVVVLPPVSTFDVMGARAWESERDRIRRMFPDLPVLDLTEAFREALPRPGVVLDLTVEGTQRVIQLPDGQTVLVASETGRSLSPDIVALFEADEDLYEPLFFDGGHPTAEGFEVFNAALVAFLSGLDLPRR